jgi:SSS family solute:Na+ symporter
LKAVIYTDTIQWLILIGGLVFIGIPIAYNAVGGYDVIKATLAPEYLSLTNVKWYHFKLVHHHHSIWFVGMTIPKNLC